jgi:ATP-dependent DNA helicase RecG
MPDSSVIKIEPLKSILNLEREKNYTDTTVSGGLDRFLKPWADETRTKITLPGQFVAFKRLKLIDVPYHSLDYDQRRKRIDDILKWLETANMPVAVPSRRKRTVVSKKNVGKEQPPAAQPAPLNADHAAVLNSPVTAIKGISTQLEGKLAKLNVHTIRDLLYLFPHRHIDYSQRMKISELLPGEDQTVIGTIWESRVVKLGRQNGTEIVIADESGSVRAVWFNQPYLAKNFHVNDSIALSGKIAQFGRMPVFESPEWELIDDKDPVHTGRIVPVYPLTQGLYPRQLRKIVKSALDEYLPHLEEFIPDDIKQRCGLLDLPAAVMQSHYPDDAVMKDRARKRLAFDELFLLQLGVLDKKRDWQETMRGTVLPLRPMISTGFGRGCPSL